MITSHITFPPSRDDFELCAGSDQSLSLETPAQLNEAKIELENIKQAILSHLKLSKLQGSELSESESLISTPIPKF